MALMLRAAATFHSGGTLFIRCPFCLQDFSCLADLVNVHQCTAGRMIYFLNGFALQNVGDYQKEVRTEVAKKKRK